MTAGIIVLVVGLGSVAGVLTETAFTGGGKRSTAAAIAVGLRTASFLVFGLVATISGKRGEAVGEASLLAPREPSGGVVEPRPFSMCFSFVVVDAGRLRAAGDASGGVPARCGGVRARCEFSFGTLDDDGASLDASFLS